MSISDTVYTLSNCNTILGSLTGFVTDKQNGTSTADALFGAGVNLSYGALGNAMARDIQNRTGSYIGYALKAAGGYTDPVANYQSTMTTFGALVMSQPPRVPFMQPLMFNGGSCRCCTIPPNQGFGFFC